MAFFNNNHPEDRIVFDPDILTENYIPERIPGREAHIQELKFCLEPAVRQAQPMNVWLFGKPGAGKTATARYVLRQLLDQARVKGAYVNCWEANTLFLVVSEILNKLRVLHTERRETEYKLDVLQRYLAGIPFVVILDEIDQPSPKERSLIIYGLASIHNTGLICICNRREFYMNLDERIKSRLNPKQIAFDPYSVQDIIFILEHRAQSAMIPDSWDNSILEQIAMLSEGDARIAIQTLKGAAQYAEKEFVRKVAGPHIEKGWNEAKNIKKTYLLRALTEDHRMLFHIIESHGEINSGGLWKEYLKLAQRRNWKPIALRTYTNYVNKLKDVGLIKIERARARGKVRVFKSTI